MRPAHKPSGVYLGAVFLIFASLISALMALTEGLYRSQKITPLVLLWGLTHLGCAASAVGLFKLAEWGRPLALVVSTLSGILMAGLGAAAVPESRTAAVTLYFLFAFPFFGTAKHLLRPEVRRFFKRKS